MYSVILMTAMTAGASETPQFGWRTHCCGCVGSYSCYGYSSCYGCHGCYGGCSGCRGGCYGGCHGSCSGCWGASAGCYGGCYGRPVLGGARLGPWAGVMYHGDAVAGPIRVYGPEVWGADYIYSGKTPFYPVTPPMEEPRKTPEKEKTTSAPARIILEVPAEARVIVDGKMTRSDSEVRYFYTPELTPGQTYYYDVKVELPGAGETLTQTRRVYVKAHDVIHESFRNLGKPAAVASK